MLLTGDAGAAAEREMLASDRPYIGRGLQMPVTTGRGPNQLRDKVEGRPASVRDRLGRGVVTNYGH